MFPHFVSWLFGRNPADSPHGSPLVATRLEGRLPTGGLPDGKVAGVFRKRLLIDLFREPPAKARVLAEGETLWLLPEEDVCLPVTLDVADKMVSLDASVRFEPDAPLGAFLDGRDAIPLDDISALVSSQLSGLLELLGQAKPDELIALDDESRERLRAKLSLLLQARGFRCTGLENFAIAPIVEPAAVTPEPAPAIIEEADGANEHKVETNAADAERELASAARQVQTDADWDRFLASLEASGFAADETAADELNDLGEGLVDRRLDADKVAGRIREMADEAARRAEIPQPDLRRWTGLALRLRTLDDSPEPVAGAAESQEAESDVEFDPARRPWTWWILRRRTVDQRLRGFLRKATRSAKASLDVYRGGLRDFRHAAAVRELDERLCLVDDMLATVPTLTPPYRQLRPDGQRAKQLVRSVERSVTAAEMIQVQVQTLLASEPGGEAWKDAVALTRIALDALADHLRARRAV